MQNKELIQCLSEAIEKSRSTIDQVNNAKTLGDTLDFDSCINNDASGKDLAFMSTREAYNRKNLKRDLVAGSTASGAFIGGLVGQQGGDKISKAGKAIDKYFNPNIRDAKEGTRKAIEKAAKEGLNVFKLDPKKITPEKRAALKKFLNNPSHKEVAKHVTKHANWVKTGRALGGAKGAAMGGALAGAGALTLANRLEKHIDKKKQKNQ